VEGVVEGKFELEYLLLEGIWNLTAVCYYVEVLFLLSFSCPAIQCMHACCITVTWWGEPGEVESCLDD